MSEYQREVAANRTKSTPIKPPSRKPTRRVRANSSVKTVDEHHKENVDRKVQIVSFVDRTLTKSPSGLRAEFQTMRRFNDFEKMKAFKAAQEHGKNRYKDVGCLDNSRVKLGAPWPHEYIHGNYVSTCTNPKRFICTQAPLEKTCADFWFMCLQDRVEVIFMLCNFLEKGAKKCFEYFPTKDKPTSLVFEEKGQKITVRFESSEQVTFNEKGITANVIETKLHVEGPNKMMMSTTHYHWIDWPDRGVPPADMAIIELLEKAKHSKGPIVVHCSAGIGRTGSVVMIEYILGQLQMGQNIEDTDKILQKIREQRNNSVQTDHQYLFVHQVMLHMFRYKKWIDEKALGSHSLDEFTANYLKLVH